jgi:hypothetical protein
MDNRKAIPSAVISDFFFETRAQLLGGELSLSDAILSLVRVARMYFTDSRLQPILRELLGYNFDQAQTAIDCAAAEEPQLQKAAKHRLIKGFRIPLFVALIQASGAARPDLSKEQWFCALSAGELEVLLAKLKKTPTPYVVLDYNEDANSAFICKVADLFELQASIRAYVARQIDLLQTDLERGAWTPTQAPVKEQTVRKPLGQP